MGDDLTSIFHPHPDQMILMTRPCLLNDEEPHIFDPTSRCADDILGIFNEIILQSLDEDNLNFQMKSSFI